MRTQRLLLRRPNADDAENLFSIFGDLRTNLYNAAGPFQDIEQAKTVLAKWIAHWVQHGFGQWAISTIELPEQIIGYGGVAYRKYGDKDCLNLGYRFCVASWGKGYATELANESLRFAFADLNMLEVYALVRPLNVPSIRVLEKIGMRKMGILEDDPSQAEGRYCLMYHVSQVKNK